MPPHPRAVRRELPRGQRSFARQRRTSFSELLALCVAAPTQHNGAAATPSCRAGADAAAARVPPPPVTAKPPAARCRCCPPPPKCRSLSHARALGASGRQRGRHQPGWLGFTTRASTLSTTRTSTSAAACARAVVVCFFVLFCFGCCWGVVGCCEGVVVCDDVFARWGHSGEERAARRTTGC